MHFPRSIRWRLQLWYGALLVAVLCGFGFTAYHLEKSRRFRRIDDGLQARLSVMVNVLRAGPERGLDKKRNLEVHLAPAQASLFGGEEGYYYMVWMQAAEPIAVSPGAPAAVPKPDNRDAQMRMRGELRESFLFAAPVNCVLVGRSIAPEQADLQTFGGALAAIGAVVLAAGLIGGWWLVTRALRPVEEISATATRIAAGDLSQRINTDETDSELGRLAGVLNATFARLDALFTQQARFTADAAHELRTPVAVMLTQTQSALARERPVAEYRETLEACQRATQRMRRLIESLLELARLDAGQEPLRRTPCDLSKIAGDCLELVRPLATARAIQIHADLPSVPCQGDGERLAQVVTNLLSNAIDYNRDGGEIRLTTHRDNGTVILTVGDTGCGISAEDLPHVFERFQRADKARTAAAGHSGLGLAIAQAIVQAHGGSIEAASEPGAGAVFTVKLPAGYESH